MSTKTSIFFLKNWWTIVQKRTFLPCIYFILRRNDVQIQFLYLQCLMWRRWQSLMWLSQVKPVDWGDDSFICEFNERCSDNHFTGQRSVPCPGKLFSVPYPECKYTIDFVLRGHQTNCTIFNSWNFLNLVYSQDNSLYFSTADVLLLVCLDFQELSVVS